MGVTATTRSLDSSCLGTIQELSQLEETVIDTSDAVPSHPVFAIQPYRVVSYPSGLHAIHNAHDINCLSFLSKPGAVFAGSKEYADAICAAWNEGVKCSRNEAPK